MAAGGSVLALALTDSADRLIRADEPLASLQINCGGEIGGLIAVPALLEAVRKARRYELRLARAITAQDGGHEITAWVEIAPREDGEMGCEISLHNWQATPISAESAMEEEARSAAIDRDLAELTARLDGAQNLLAVECEAADLAGLAEQMRGGIGQPWTDFVTLEAGGFRQPMHWRLLDGARIKPETSARTWKARLHPHVVPGAQPSGFDLFLVSDEAPQEVQPLAGVGAAQAVPGMIGRDIAPVLRLPIARIIANAETIRTRMAGPLADEYADYATDIATAGQHLLALLDDLSDLEVVESEDFSTAPDPIDLADVARRAAGILGVRARECGIVIDAPKLGETLPAIAEFRRVLQILLNLVGNAIRYSPANSQVWIRLEEADGKAQVIVADQGPGIAADEQARVFEKFERLGRSGDGGSGLGLYISRKLARAMGGELQVESALGQGARFILSLPSE